MTHLTDFRPASYPELMPARLITSLPELEDLRPMWQKLEQGEGYTRFQSFEWNLLAARIMGNREVPVFAVTETGNGAAIIPAVQVGDELSLAGETLFDYRTVLSCGEPDAMHPAWSELSSMGLPLRFTAYREGTRTPHSRVLLEEFVAAPAVLSEVGMESHPRLERYLVALKRSGCELRRHSGPSRRLLDHIYVEKSKQPGSLFTDSLRRELAIQMFLAIDSTCEVFTIETAGTLVAALVTFLERNWRRCYTTYFHPAWAKYSPGTVLLDEAVETTIAEGRDCDLMTGEQAYKTRLANSRVHLYRASISVDVLRGQSASAEAA